MELHDWIYLASGVVGITGGILTGVRMMLSQLHSRIDLLDKHITNHVMHQLEDLRDGQHEQAQRLARVETFIEYLRK